MYHISWFNFSNTNGGAVYLDDIKDLKNLLDSLVYDFSDLTIIIKKVR